jgi:hypothetical protein
VPTGVLGQGDGVGEAEWLDEPGAQGGLPRAVVEHLDDAAEHDEPAVAVGVRRTGIERAVQPGQQGDVPLEAVVAAPGVVEDVAVEPAAVGEQVADGHQGGRIVAADAYAGEQVGDRVVVREPALLDQLGRHGRGPGLGDRPDLEDAVGGRAHAGACAQHAVRRDRGGAVVPHPEHRPRDAGPARQVGQAAGPVLLVHGAQPAGACSVGT